MGSEDIPGFDEDPELEDLLSTDPNELDEDTLQDLQLYKSRKLQAKRDAEMSTDRPSWWPEDALAPERLEEVGSAGGGAATTSSSSEESADEDEPSEEKADPSESETAEEQEPEEEQAAEEPSETDETQETEDREEDEEDSTEPEAPEGEEPAPRESGEPVEVDISETDFEIDPEMEELLEEDIFNLDEETRSEVQLYKSRKMQAKRDARREAGGGQASGGDDSQTVEGGGESEDEFSKKAPPPADTARYKGERKIKDLVSSRKSGRQVTRRGFISSFGLGWLAGLAAFGTGAVSSLRYFYPNVLSNPPEKFIAGEPQDYPPNSVSAKYKGKYRVWITNLGDRIVAILAVCTHLGCTPNWLDSKGIFKCPCHGSAYYQTGVNFAGPAPRPMDRVAVRLNPQGKIVVDKSKQFSSQASPGWNADDAYIKV